MERIEEPEEESFSLQDGILVEMCCFVKQFYPHVLLESEIALVYSILQLEPDSRKMLFAL